MDLVVKHWGGCEAVTKPVPGRKEGEAEEADTNQHSYHSQNPHRATAVPLN